MLQGLNPTPHLTFTFGCSGKIINTLPFIRDHFCEVRFRSESSLKGGAGRGGEAPGPSVGHPCSRTCRGPLTPDETHSYPSAHGEGSRGERFPLSGSGQGPRDEKGPTPPDVAAVLERGRAGGRGGAEEDPGPQGARTAPGAGEAEGAEGGGPSTPSLSRPLRPGPWAGTSRPDQAGPGAGVGARMGRGAGREEGRDRGGEEGERAAARGGDEEGEGEAARKRDGG